MIQLGDSRSLDRVCQDLLGIEILPEVDVKNAKRIPARRIEKTTNGGLADGGALRQRSEADGIRLFGQLETPSCWSRRMASSPSSSPPTRLAAIPWSPKSVVM